MLSCCMGASTQSAECSKACEQHVRAWAIPSQVAGTTGRIQQDLHNEEEEGISAEAHGQAIVEALGQEK